MSCIIPAAKSYVILYFYACFELQGASSSKTLSSSGSSGSKIQTLSPAHKNSFGMVNSQAG